MRATTPARSHLCWEFSVGGCEGGKRLCVTSSHERWRVAWALSNGKLISSDERSHTGRKHWNRHPLFSNEATNTAPSSPVTIHPLMCVLQTSVTQPKGHRFESLIGYFIGVNTRVTKMSIYRCHVWLFVMATHTAAIMSWKSWQQPVLRKVHIPLRAKCLWVLAKVGKVGFSSGFLQGCTHSPNVLQTFVNIFSCRKEINMFKKKTKNLYAEDPN